MALEAEFKGYLARYAYMDEASHVATVLEFWKGWTSAHEAANQMIRDCFDENGLVNEAKLAWIVETKMRSDVKEEIESCFSIIQREGDPEPRLRADDSRLNIIIKEWAIVPAIASGRKASWRHRVYKSGPGVPARRL